MRRDVTLIPRVVEEGLRYDAPVQGMFRTTTEDVEMHGVTLPAGARVFVVFGAANRDEQIFAHPDRFDPWRSNVTSISPLGMVFITASGHRSCVWRRASHSKLSYNVCPMCTSYLRNPLPTCRTCSTVLCNVSRCPRARPRPRYELTQMIIPSTTMPIWS